MNKWVQLSNGQWVLRPVINEQTAAVIRAWQAMQLIQLLRS